MRARSSALVGILAAMGAAADRIRSFTSAAVRPRTRGFSGYESSRTSGSRSNPALEAWPFFFGCRAGGERHDETWFVMVEGNMLWIWTGRGGSLAFHRGAA